MIPDALFARAAILTNSLKLNVEEIGQYAFYGSGSSIGESSIRTLEIGENVTRIGRGAFGAVTYDKVVVYAVKTDNDLVTYAGEVPTCKSVEIHGNADSYDYFTKNTDEDNITLLCKDFKTTYGDEYFDEDKGTFVTPVTDTCPVCGYEAKREEYVDGYTVIFYDADGNELSRQGVKHGEAAKTPEAPKKESTPQYSYTFKGWDGDTDNITGNVSFHPIYESQIRSYTVTFMNGSDEVDKQTVEYGGSATLPKDPTRPAEEWGSWKFIGWEGNYENVMKDEVVQAQFEKVMKEYEVIFYDAGGNELSRQKVKHGEAAETPEAPKKESTPQYSYTFKGWDGDTDNITGNVSFHPVYETKTRTYTVTFMNGDQMVDKQTVEYGQAATLPNDPVKEADDKYTYTFARWDGNYSYITEDTVIYALFDKEHKTPETGDKGDEGEPEQENPESGDQGTGTTPSQGGDSNQETGSGTVPGQDGDSNQETGSGTAPRQDSDSDQETDSGNELGNPDAGTNEGSGGQTEEPDLSTEGRIFRVAMPAPSISDWIFNDTASAAEEEPEEISKKYEESDIIENELDTADMADTDDADDTDDRQDLTVPDTGAYRRDNSWPTWLMPLLGMIAAGAFLICLYLILRNRKAYGIILNVYGSPECGAQITMIGKDMPESETNKNGWLRIDGLKKDDYRVKVTQKKGYRMLSVDIVMENRDKEETLTILES